MKLSDVAKVCTIGTAVAGLIAAFLLYRISMRLGEPVAPRYEIVNRTGVPVQPLPEILTGVRTIVFFGDSITRADNGYSYFDLTGKYLRAVFPDRSFNLINAGVNGHTSSDLLQRLDSDVTARTPDLVIVLVGVNDVGHGFDAAHPKGEGPDGVSLAQYLDNMKEIMSRLKSVKRVIVTPLVAGEVLDSRPNELLNRYVTELRSLASKEKILLVDVNTVYRNLIFSYRTYTGSHDLLLTTDGFHPNELGARVIAECLLDKLGITGASRQKVLRQNSY